MASDSGWDIEQYRTKFESDEHWALKRDFMEAHRDKFPEERLICLAQVYVNIELLRCKYPDAVMRQVNELAKGIGNDYKAKQKLRLQRTFVKASDAASAKVKGQKRPCEMVHEARVKSKRMKTRDEEEQSYSLTKSLPTTSNRASDMTTEQGKTLINTWPSSSNEFPSDTNRCNYYSNLSNRMLTPEQEKDPYGANIFLVHYAYCRFIGFHSMLMNSLQFSEFRLVDTYSTESNRPITTCWLSAVKKHFSLPLETAKGASKKEAKENAAQKSIEMLLRRCIVLKKTSKTSGAEKISLKESFVENTTENESGNEKQKLSEENIGAKMLKLMGWSGGGLGKSGAGITEPVQASKVIGRQGLGLKNETLVTKEFRKKVTKLLQDFASSESLSELIFSSELSKDQRKEIHSIAAKSRNQFKTNSFGKNDDRYIVVRHKLKSSALIDEVKKKGGVTDNYTLLQPGTVTIDQLTDAVSS